MQEALDRKERLKALKQAAALAEGGAEAPAAAQEQPVLKFRNYAPSDEKLEHEKVAPAQPPKFEEPVVDPAPQTTAADTVVNIAPKKANWDLKREVGPMLEKLERRTQRALIELMQEEERARLAADGGIAD